MAALYDRPREVRVPEAWLPQGNAVAPPGRRARAASSTLPWLERERRGRGAGQPGSPASLQEKSAGTINVATFPGGPSAAATAADAGFTHGGGVFDGSHPTRYRPRESLYIGRQRSIVGQMLRGMLTARC